MTILVLIASVIFLIALVGSVWFGIEATGNARAPISQPRSLFEIIKIHFLDWLVVACCTCGGLTALYALAKLWGYL